MALPAHGVHPALHEEPGLGIWDNGVGVCFNWDWVLAACVGMQSQG